MWDVIIAGGGPAGSAASKACAERGLKTLVLEKKKLPRDKVCSGMVAGLMAQELVRNEFGDIPQSVLSTPGELSGQMFHVPGAEPESLEWKTLLAWRKDLDFWFVEKAEEKGAAIWDNARFLRAEENEGRFLVHIQRGHAVEAVTAEFLVGADGAGSQVRKFLFPDLKVRYSVPIRECYEGALDLDKGYLHWFFPKSRPRPRFNVNHKGDCFLVEGSGVKELRTEIMETLAPYGFHPESKPFRRDACLIPWLHEGLISGSFHPARGNALLVGDAAGLLFPITFEGIGVAIKSGILAAASISEAARLSTECETLYLEALSPVIKELETLHLLGKKIETSAADQGGALLAALKEGYEATLRVF